MSGDGTLVRRVTIRNRRGLHARAAARFVEVAGRFAADVEVVRDGVAVSARSIMGLMMLAASAGADLELRGRGADADAALAELARLVEAKFDED